MDASGTNELHIHAITVCRKALYASTFTKTLTLPTAAAAHLFAPLLRRARESANAI